MRLAGDWGRTECSRGWDRCKRRGCRWGLSGDEGRKRRVCRGRIRSVVWKDVGKVRSKRNGMSVGDGRCAGGRWNDDVNGAAVEAWDLGIADDDKAAGTGAGAEQG